MPSADELRQRPRHKTVAVDVVRGRVVRPLCGSAIRSVQLAIDEDARGAIVVENAETSRHLQPLADQGWIVIHIPGGPPAEAQTPPLSRSGRSAGQPCLR